MSYLIKLEQKSFPEEGITDFYTERESVHDAIMECIINSPDSLIKVVGVYQCIPVEFDNEWRNNFC